MNNQMGGNIEKNVDNKIEDNYNMNRMELLKELKELSIQLSKTYISNIKIEININTKKELPKVSVLEYNL